MRINPIEWEYQVKHIIHTKQPIKRVRQLFLHKVRSILSPYSESINHTNPNKVNILETIASIQNDIKSKSNFERIITVLSDMPKEKEKCLLTSFSSFLKENRIVSKDKVSSVNEEIKKAVTTNICTERNDAVAKQQLKEEQDLLQHSKETADFLKTLNSYIKECESTDEWFEDKTYVERFGGDYRVHIGQPNTDEATDFSLFIPEGSMDNLCKNSNVTFRAGILHGGRYQVENNVARLIEALHRSNLDKQSFQHGKSRIKITLSGNHLLSIYIYALPKDGRTVFKCLKAGENRLDLPSDNELNKDALVGFENHRAFYVFSHCLRTGDTYYNHADLTINNLRKFNVMMVTGNEELLNYIEKKQGS